MTWCRGGLVANRNKVRRFDGKGNLDDQPAQVPAVVPAPQPSVLSRARPELVEDAREAFEAVRSTGTKASYESDWEGFKSFCQRENLLPFLPADPDTVVVYLRWLSKRASPSRGRRKGKKGFAAGTIDRARASIAHFHRQAKLPSPTADYRVKEAMKGIKNLIGVDPRRAWPILPMHLGPMLEWLTKKRRGMRLVRDRALVLACFVGALRKGEVVALRRSDVTVHDDGILFVLARHQGRKKADVEQGTKSKRQGSSIVDWRLKGDDDATRALDPVSAIRDWLKASGGTDDDLAFRPVKECGEEQVESGAISSRKVD